MKRTVLALIVIATVVFAQEQKTTEQGDPCDHPVIKKAETTGLNSLTLKEIPQFLMAARRCKREAKKSGKEIDFGKLYDEKRKKNFDNARELSGPGSFFLTVTALVLLYSYVALAAGAD